MGAIQQATPGMGPYGTEIRRESFYLTVSGPSAQLEAQAVDGRTLRVPVGHTRYLLASLQQVTEHLGWRDWDGVPRTGGIELTRDGDDLTLRLPQPVHVQRYDDATGADTSISTEIEYQDVSALREALAAFA